MQPMTTVPRVMNLRMWSNIVNPSSGTGIFPFSFGLRQIWRFHPGRLNPVEPSNIPRTSHHPPRDHSICLGHWPQTACHSPKRIFDQH